MLPIDSHRWIEEAKAGVYVFGGIDEDVPPTLVSAAGKESRKIFL